MKKRTMRNWFIFLFVIGVVIGFLIPWDIWDAVEETQKNGFQSSVIDVANKFGQLETVTDNFDYSIVSGSDDMSAMLLRLKGKIAMHVHPDENHILFIYRGKVKAMIGGTPYDLEPGSLVTIPAKAVHSIEKVGDMPAEIIVIAQPPSDPKDIKYVQE